jgi:ferrous iron transport protein A
MNAKLNTSDTFSSLKPGDSAEIIGFAGGDASYRSRLLAFGLLKGTHFVLTKVAPAGDPVEIQVRGYRLSLRKKEAEVLQLRKDK